MCLGQAAVFHFEMQRVSLALIADTHPVSEAMI